MDVGDWDDDSWIRQELEHGSWCDCVKRYYINKDKILYI